MSKIKIVTSLRHEPNRIELKATFFEETTQPDFFIAGSVPVGSTTQSLPSNAEVVSPGNTYLQNSAESSGDILLTVDDGNTFPFRLKPGAGVPLRMNNEDYREISTVEVNADDVAGSMAGKYFDLEDRNGPIRVWLDMPGRAEVSSIQTVADVGGNLNQTYFTIYDNAGSVGVWIDVDDSGSAAPSTGADRNIEVTGVATGDSAADVATAVQAALDADGQFSASEVFPGTVAVTDAVVGARTDIADVDTGFTVAAEIQGISAPSAPATPAGGRLVAVDISIDAADSAIATAIWAAFASDTEISATVNGLVVTLSDNNTGARSSIADGAGGDATGFVFTTVDEGATAPVVKIKSTSTSWLLYGAAQF